MGFLALFRVVSSALVGVDAADKAVRRDVHLADRLFRGWLGAAVVSLVVLLAAIGLYLARLSEPAIAKFGWGFIVGTNWDPVQEVFGALPVIYGTVVSSLLALFLAAPISIGAALVLTELAPARTAAVVGFLIEMLAAIPSVVFGLWGIFVLVPWLRTVVEPMLGASLGFLPLFSGPPYGVGMLAAGMVLGIMLTPTITSICREVFRAVPRLTREGALALGATPWETIRIAVLQSSRSGILGAVVLGLGRVLGETMAVTMVIGNRAEISASLLAPGQTMASAIANEYVEATSSLHLAALVEIGLLLFAVTIVLNSLARLIVRRVGQDGR